MSLLLAKQIGILFIYIFAGFLLVRSGLLRSEQSGVMTWRTYLDGGFAGEAAAVLQ